MRRAETILVTGGAGFIGSHVSEKLIALGYHVILIDVFHQSKKRREKEGNILSIIDNPHCSIIDVDIGDQKKINKIFNQYQIDVVLHLSAKADVAESIAQPAWAIETNLLGATIIFEEARKYGISHIVYASSALIYGKGATAPMREDDPCLYSTSPYAVSMRAVELSAYAFYQTCHISVTGLRLFPVYGPRMRKNLVIPVLVSNISQGKPVTILGDGKQKRSYTYIDDTVAGIIASLGKPNGYQLVNLGYPSPISLVSLITLIEKVLGKKAKRVFKPMRKEDLPLLYPDINKAKKLLGFSPKISLKDGLKRYITWYQNQKPHK